MLRLLVASGNLIEGVMGLFVAGTAAYIMLTVGFAPATMLLLIYGVALVLLHALSAFYALGL